MGEKRDRHRCSNAACGKTFAVVYREAPGQATLPVYLPCPHCGISDFFFVGTAAVRQPDGTYVIPLNYRVEAIDP